MTSESRMNSWDHSISLGRACITPHCSCYEGILSTVFDGVSRDIEPCAFLAYLPDITADLADLRQELDRRHPFVGAQTRLACKVVHVCH